MHLLLAGILISLGLWLPVAGEAQEPCTIDIDKAPEIRGVKLGMTTSQVKALYPSIKEPIDRDEVGISATLYMAGIDDPIEQLKGVDTLSLFFFNSRLYQISVSYKEPSYWQEVSELTKPLNLPNLSNKDYTRAVCKGFEATIFHHSDDQKLTLTDSRAQRKIGELLMELKEKSADCQKLPVLRGIALGMNVAKFRGLYSPAHLIRNRTDVGELVLRKIAGDDQRLKGINTLWAYFLDGELYFLVIDYSNQIEWKGIDEFVEHFSKATGLRTKWDGYFDERTLRCERFTVSAEFKDGRPRVKVQDRSALVKLTNREERLKSPASFRP